MRRAWRQRSFGRRVGVLSTALVLVAAVLAVWVPRREQPAAIAAGQVTKVLWIWEENTNPDDIIGTCTPGCQAMPYLNALANTYGWATQARAASFPSLPNYIAGTSGDLQGVADDALPQKHPLTAPSIFGQLPLGQAKVFAESMTTNCQLDDGAHTDINGAGYYTVRRTGWPYYVNERAACQQHQVPMVPHLQNAVAQGLPAFSEVVPATCNNFHLGHPDGTCQFAPGGTYESRADDWLETWVPRIMAGPDWQAGRLAIFIVWDEGDGSAPVYGEDCTVSSLKGCRIPIVVLSPGTRRVADPAPYTIYSVLRTTEELLGLPLLGRAASALSMGAAFGLTGGPGPLPPSRFVPLAPRRLLDTRPGAPTFDGVAAGAGRVPPGGSLDVPVTGRGVPAGASAVVLNVTAIDATGPGFVQVFPTGRGVVGASSNLNIEHPGQIIPNLVIAPLGDGGRLTIYTQGGTHLAADALGYFEPSQATAGGRYQALSPSRLLDTRSGLGAAQPGPLAKGEVRTVRILGRGGVPAAGVSAVVLNVTSVASSTSGYVQVIPTGGPTPLGGSSNLNVVPGQTIPNLVMVPVGSGGSVTVFDDAGGHLLADVFGYFTDGTASSSAKGLFTPLSPARLLDTRVGSRPAAGSQTALQPLGQQGIPFAGVSAVFLNLTATQSGAAGWVQVLPAGEGPPGGYSNLNLDRAGQTIPNAAVSPLGVGGELRLYTLNATHLLADTAGWFSA